MSLFLLKKIIGILLMPFSISLILLLLALFFFNKRPKLAFRSVFLAFGILFFSAFPPLSKWLIKPLETQFPAYKNRNQQVDYIAILGCYHTNDKAIPATSQLASCSLQRLVEGLRIYHLHPEANLIVSGGSGQHSNAYVMKQAAISLGIPASKIFPEYGARDTEDEAQLVAPRLTSQSILITNADSMPRAIKYFQQYGANPIAAPVYTYYKNNDEPIDWGYFVPRSKNITQTETAWYEYLGLVAQWVKQLF